MKTSRAVLSILVTLTAFVGNAGAQEPEFWSWAQTPPMGWNSWDSFGPTVTEAEVRANADYMADNLASHGWEYVVVDIRWYVENTSAGDYNQDDPRYVMDEYGRLLPALNRFPSAADGRGFTTLADYVHSKGLKFGIHLMRGVPVEAVNRNTAILGSEAHAADIYTTDRQCRWLADMYTVLEDREGAQEYYNSVFDLIASWGVDYVKVDDLSRSPAEIEMIRQAIDRTGRPMVLSVSPGGARVEDGDHFVNHANLWRISGDFWDSWDAVERQFPRTASWAPFIGAGHWPDADMLPLGHIGIRAHRGDDRMSLLTHTEQITLMSLWSIFRSPLMFGGDLPGNDAFTLSLLTNDEVLAVNQHSTRNRQVSSADGLVVWAADIPNSADKYVAMFNTNTPDTDLGETQNVSVSLAELGVVGESTVRDLWEGQDLGSVSTTIVADIPAHGSVLYRVSPR